MDVKKKKKLTSTGYQNLQNKLFGSTGRWNNNNVDNDGHWWTLWRVVGRQVQFPKIVYTYFFDPLTDKNT